MAIRDPYKALGVGYDASDADIQAAYRRLVKLHHPDHNAGSAQSARRFEEVQDAYAQIKRQREASPPPRAGRTAPPRADRTAPPRAARTAPPPRRPTDATPLDPELEAQMRDLERQVQDAHEARETARKAASEAARAAAAEAAAETARRPTDEELGIYTTDDSFSNLIDDAAAELGKRVAHAGDHHAKKRVADLLEELAAKLRREQD